MITCLVDTLFLRRGERSGVANTILVASEFNPRLVCVSVSELAVFKELVPDSGSALGEGVISGEPAWRHASGSGTLCDPFGKVGLGSCASGGVFP